MKKYLFGFFSVLVFIFAFFYTSTVQAAGNSYFVSLTGSDTNAGSQSAPFKTFAKGVATMQAGDTLFIFGGTYAERLAVSKSGTAGSPLLIQPVSGQKVIIDQNNTADKAINLTGSYIHVSGIETKLSKADEATGTCVNVQGQYNRVSGLTVHDCHGHGIFTDGQHNTIDGNTVYLTNLQNKARSMSSGWGSAIKVRVGGDDITIENNTVYHNYGEGIAVTRGINSTVRNNKSYDNFAVNLYIDNSHDILVEKNFVWCTPNSGFEREYEPGQWFSATGIHFGEEPYSGWGNQLHSVTVRNNISAFCKNAIGSSQINSLDSIKIINNTLWGGVHSTLKLATYNGLVLKNNIIQHPTGSLTSISSGTGMDAGNNFWVSPGTPTSSVAGPGDKSGDVKLAATAGFTPESFRLSSTSPAINGGVVLSEIADDYENKARNGNPDVGAIEYSGSSSPPTITSTQVPALTCPPAGVSTTGQAKLTVNLLETGNYKIWGQVKDNDSASSVLYVKLDNAACVKVGDAASMSDAWTWVSDGSSTLLAPGAHEVTLYGTGVSLDRILVTRDTSCTPTGNGDLCIGVVSTPTPVVSTPTNTPTRAPTNTPALTPTPVEGPKITTNSLPSATRNKSYTTPINATDPTISDILGMTATGLPPGIMLGECTQSSGFGGTTLVCTLTGIPTNKGNYQSSFTVIDRAGHSAKRNLKFQVR